MDPVGQFLRQDFIDPPLPRQARLAGEGLGYDRNVKVGIATSPALIDSCYAYRSDGEVVKAQWPAFYSGK